jgi:hypothetical protein
MSPNLIWNPETQSYVLYLGFSGRSSGLTEPQRKTLRELLDAHDRSSCIALHNDGVGADQEFAALAAELGFRVKVTRSDLNPMPRNRELADLCAKLFAAPPTDFLLAKGSGSWETIKYVWKRGKHAFIILSDGRLVTDKAGLPPKPQIAAVSFDDQFLVVRFSSGEERCVDLSVSSRLRAASAEERAVWSPIGFEGIHFPLIDEDISLDLSAAGVTRRVGRVVDGA